MTGYLRVSDLAEHLLGGVLREGAEDPYVCLGPDGCGALVVDRALHDRHHQHLRQLEHQAQRADRRSRRPWT